MSQYAYSPLPDSKSFIRLLSIISVEDTITCALEDFPIDDPPPFHAVSYCWGTEPACEKIYVGSEWIALTLHLLEGIRSLHKQANPPKLWIDAICINQTDNIEKSGQIPLMGRIYRNADKVLVWLGRGMEWSDRAMRSIPDLSEKISLLRKPDLFDEIRLQEVGIPLGGDPIWEGFGHIFSSAWFGRLWPLQEVTLAKEVDFFSGDSSTKMIPFTQLVLAMGIKLFGYIIDHMPDYQSNNNIARVVELVDIRINVPSLSKPGGAFKVLNCSRKKQATEPLDYVYGVLGMLSEDINSRITVDYSEKSKTEFRNVYVDLACILLRENFYALLGMVETKVRLRELPSWCPNWASSASVTTTFKQDYRAGHGKSTTLSRAAIFDQARLIQCPGFVLDHIVATVPLFFGVPPDYDWKDSMELCEHVVQSRSILPIEHNILRIARTLVANGEIDFADMKEKSYGSTLVRDYTLTKYCLRYMDSDKNAKPLDVPDDVFKEAFRNYSRTLNMLWYGRCFFITESGFLGLGPEVTEVGDAVCVLIGANTPYILCERPSHPGVYQLIGQAYVDGIMDGESMETRDPANDRDFVIS